MLVKTTHESPWMFVQYDPITMQSLYMKREGDLLHFQKRIPMWLAEQMLDENKQKAKDFDDNGGWKGAKYGAVVANIPDHIENNLKRQCGFDPTKSGWYDKDKYDSILDDIDYSKLRTGGGKIGKKLAPVIWSPKRVKSLVGL